jgi:2-hydroxychromene-2-carboxylate isomerase
MVLGGDPGILVKRLEFYFDLASPYSYLAHTQLGRIRRETGAEVLMRPMLVGAVFTAAGTKAPAEVPAKRRYQRKDLRRWAKRYGVPLVHPEPFPFRSVDSMRAAAWIGGRGGQEEEALEAFVREAFSLYWGEGNAPEGMAKGSEDGPLSELAGRIGLDPAGLLEAASSPEAREALERATTEAVGRGVFGAPTFFVGEEMFWGNDRLGFAAEALRGNALGRGDREA